ncbi:VMAP-C domain-containing protein [Kitasatospora sp. NPDC054939]
MAPDDPDRAVKLAHAALHWQSDAEAYGGGVLLTPDTVLTCAHVVNQVFGRDDFAQQRPDGLDGLTVALPGTDPRLRLHAALVAWLPARRPDGSPAQAGDIEWAGDLALLRLLHPPAAARPAPVGRCRPGRTAYAWFGSGAPSTIAAAVVQGVTERWIVLDSPGSAQAVVEGYSGSPLWDREQQRVVGLVVGRSGLRAFAVPTWDLGRLFAEAGEPVPALAGPEEAPLDPLVQQLLGPIRAVLPSPAGLAALTAQFLADLGPDGPENPGGPEYPGRPENPDGPEDPGRPGDPPGPGGHDRAAVTTPEQLARLAAAAPHGVPTLLARLAAAASGTEQRQWIATTGVLASPERFLTAGEHRELLDLLAAGAPDPRRCAAEALPLGPDLRSPDWPAAVAELERYRPRHGRVPQLLRTVEFAAARAGQPATARALTAWNDAVAHRLGLAEALPEHRAQALESAEARRTAAGAAGRPGGAPAAPVVQVQLWRATGTDTFGYTLHAADADGLPLHRSTCDTPVPRSRLLAELGALLEDLTRHTEPGAVPTVEWFVPADELDLAVDQWVYRPDELFPGVLGQDFLCVIRSPELRRAAFLPELRYRWQALRSGRVALLERHDPAVQQRGAPVPVCGVALCCPSSELPRLRAIALAVGVPGVVWLRPTAPGPAPGRLRELVDGSAPHELPRVVYEARLGESPDGLHRNLALVWDGPEGHPDTLRLGDPRD